VTTPQADFGAERDTLPAVRNALVHIGYHKTGSGWLREQFFARPETGFVRIPKSENHPIRELVRARPFEFDPEASRAAFEPYLLAAEERGLVPVASFERLSGHPFSGGYDAKEIADRLHLALPDAIVLAVIREQRTIIASTYKQYVRHGGAVGVRDFLEPKRNPAMHVPWFHFGHFEYHHLIGYYQTLFGADRVLVLAFEQFTSDPQAFVAQISRFAGVPLAPETMQKLKTRRNTNPAPQATGIAVARRVNHLGIRSEVNPAPLFDIPVLERLKARRVRAPWGLNDRPERRLKAEIEEIVGDRYRESNRITSGLTGLDLTRLGWKT
jgi:sulfotransferase family protein